MSLEIIPSAVVNYRLEQNHQQLVADEAALHGLAAHLKAERQVREQQRLLVLEQGQSVAPKGVIVIPGAIDHVVPKWQEGDIISFIPKGPEYSTPVEEADLTYGVAEALIKARKLESWSYWERYVGAPLMSGGLLVGGVGIGTQVDWAGSIGAGMFAAGMSLYAYTRNADPAKRVPQSSLDQAPPIRVVATEHA